MTAPPLVFAFDPSTPDASLRDLVRRAGPVAALTLDLGGGDDLEAVRDRALGAGALRAHVIDARSELAAEVVGPALAAGALSPPVNPVALALPVMVRRLVEVARIEGAVTIGHALEGPDALVLERLVRSLAPDLAIVGPGPDAPAQATRAFATLWGRAVRFDAAAAPARLFTRTRDPGARPSETAVVEIAIEAGVPVAVNGIALALDELIEVVGTIAGDHGVGRFDHRSGDAAPVMRAIIEAPAAVVLADAVEALAAVTLDPLSLSLRRQLAPAYAGLLTDGHWHTPARTALDAFTAASAAAIAGTVALQLSEGACRVTACRPAAAAAEPAGCAAPHRS
ncbi:MAG TPA: argininosuccinate synthase domain-containing protein [Vicinamibacterales bacterium]